MVKNDGTHIHVDAGDREDLDDGKVSGHEPVELVTVFVPLDWVEWLVLQVVLALEQGVVASDRVFVYVQGCQLQTNHSCQQTTIVITRGIRESTEADP